MCRKIAENIFDKNLKFFDFFRITLFSVDFCFVNIFRNIEIYAKLPSKLFVELCRKIAENILIFTKFFSLYFLIKKYLLIKCHHRNFLLKCVVKFQHAVILKSYGKMKI
jgi:hypothetical protein